MNMTMDFKGIWINLPMKSLKTKQVVEWSGEISSRNESKNGVIEENRSEVNWEIKTEELSNESQRQVSPTAYSKCKRKSPILKTEKINTSVKDKTKFKILLAQNNQNTMKRSYLRLKRINEEKNPCQRLWKYF